MSRYLFTSESVSMGHPDKVSDQISDGILDALLTQDPNSRVACETLCTTDLVVVSGEVTTNGWADCEKVTRDIIRDIGYNSDDVGFNADTFKMMIALHSQSADIAQGVDREGAGDQGLMFGYACNQTEEFMPVPIALSHRILNRLTEARQNEEVNWLRPDSKSQVTVEYEGSVPVGVSAVVVSTQHNEEVSQEEISEFIRESIVKETIPAGLLNTDTKYHISNRTICHWWSSWRHRFDRSQNYC